MPVLVFENVSFSYRNRISAVENISFSIERGESVSVIGPNGCGKSTLARLACGLLVPSSGNVCVRGLNCSKSSLYYMAKHVGIALQDPSRQVSSETVLEEITSPLLMKGFSREQAKHEALGQINKFGLEDKINSHPLELSRGQAHRLAIASVIAKRPELMILDEPTAGLDARWRLVISHELREYIRSGNSILLITHDLTLAGDVCDRVLAMNSKRIIKDARAEKVLFDDRLMDSLGYGIPQVVNASRLLHRDYGIRKTCSLSLLVREISERTSD